MALKEMSYDPKVYELAQLFLEDEPELNSKEAAHRLAQCIQDAIENEIDWMKTHPDKAGKPYGGI
jgi:ribonucleotide reductase beta subunit family protein with ferritin-like domain